MAMEPNGLPFYVKWELGGDPNQTCLQARIQVPYSVLVAVFGPPNNTAIDGYKVDAEWTLTFDIFNGMTKSVATIYNYKTGKNYLGAEGLAVEDITDWHIGGKNEGGSDLVGYVCSMIITHLIGEKK